MTLNNLITILNNLNIVVSEDKIEELINSLNNHPEVNQLLHLDVQKVNVNRKYYDNPIEAFASIVAVSKAYTILGKETDFNRIINIDDAVGYTFTLVFNDLWNISQYDKTSKFYELASWVSSFSVNTDEFVLNLVNKTIKLGLIEELFSIKNTSSIHNTFIDFAINHFDYLTSHEKQFLSKSGVVPSIRSEFKKIMAFRTAFPNTDIPSWATYFLNYETILASKLNPAIFQYSNIEDIIKVNPRLEFWFYISCLVDLNTVARRVNTRNDIINLVVSLKKKYQKEFSNIREVQFMKIIEDYSSLIIYLQQQLVKILFGDSNVQQLDMHLKSFQNNVPVATSAGKCHARDTATIKLLEFVATNPNNLNKVKYLISIGQLDSLLHKLVNINGLTVFSQYYTILFALSQLGLYST